MNQYDHFELDREDAVRELTARRHSLRLAASRKKSQLKLPSSLDLARAKERESAAAAAQEPSREA